MKTVKLIAGGVAEWQAVALRIHVVKKRHGFESHWFESHWFESRLGVNGRDQKWSGKSNEAKQYSKWKTDKKSMRKNYNVW